jgi:hypothetical protein
LRVLSDLFNHVRIGFSQSFSVISFDWQGSVTIARRHTKKLEAGSKEDFVSAAFEIDRAGSLNRYRQADTNKLRPQPRSCCRFRSQFACRWDNSRRR